MSEQPICVYCGESINAIDPAHKGYNVDVHRHCVSFIITKFGYGMIDALPKWMKETK